MLASAITSHEHILGGRALGLASLEPWPPAPEYRLSTLLPGFQSISFIGLFAAHGTPLALAEKLTHEFRTVLNEPDMRKKMLDLGALPSSIGTTTADFREFLAVDSKTWGDVINAGKSKKH